MTRSVQVPVRWLGEGAPRLPAYQTSLAAGVDLSAEIKEPVTLAPFERKLIPTGLGIALPAGYEAQIRPRSGLAYRHGLTVLNSPGTIDADYRGELKVLLINLGQEAVTLNPRERIAQLVIAPVQQVQWELVESLGTTERGLDGFGSTGR
jgi:dUTP pyrophosphatase